MSEGQAVIWSEDAIFQRLKMVAQEQLNLTPEQVTAIQPDSPLVETLRLDSLGQVILVTAVETDFGYTFDLDQWRQLETVHDLVKMIAVRAGGEQPA